MLSQIPIPAGLIEAVLKPALGARPELAGVEQLLGGARKQVFRLRFTRPIPDIVLLAWQNVHDYFGERNNLDSTRSDEQAPLLYKANTELMLRQGLRVPRIYHYDDSRQAVPFTYALVEYMTGRSLNEWRAARTQPEVQSVLLKLRRFLDAMHSIQRTTYGTLLDTSPNPRPAHTQAYQEILPDLEGLAETMPQVRLNQPHITARLEALWRQVQPRECYAFIHNEIGPDEHLLVDENGEITLIDLDGCHFYDIEREFAYLKIRFGQEYETLRRDDLDPDRMAFYSLCIHISAAYGHYRLYQQGFPDPEMLREIYEWNVEKILEITRRQ